MQDKSTANGIVKDKDINQQELEIDNEVTK